MAIVLPLGWIELSDKNDTSMVSYQKTYPDGLDVVLTIEYRNEMYELWSLSEHRCSGPEKHMDSTHTDVKSALKAALDEMVEWDND
ncbi:hypothetical protein [Vibrio diazotrophicus]|uniref:hypothetical protein n=1 Tax=Vibrio diazotrophicus TaxID=685 RepID=UPI00142E6DED|nr:hypothetical protein [Vibrio diazotrophicus]NIY94665.1 hypothetical protein [Vibrio diazotrophicus]